MIWESTVLMTMVDLAIISVTGASIHLLLKFRHRLNKADATLGFSIIVLGLGLVGTFYVFDLFTMFGLPQLTSPGAAHAVMTNLHLNYSWIVMLLGTLTIFCGFTLTNMKMFRLLETKEKIETQAQDIFNSCPSLIFLKDLKGRYQHVNQPFEKAFCLQREDIIGKTDEEIFSPRQATSFWTNEQQVLQAQTPIEFEATVIHDDGPHVSIVHKFPLKDPNGHLYGIGGIATDITQRNQTEEELRQSQALVGAIVENIPSMIFVKDAKDLRFVLLNKAGEDLLGYQRHELIGRNDYDFFPKEQADFFAAKDREVLEGCRLVEIPEEQIQTQDKDLRLLHTKKVPILDSKGNPEFLLGISQDITERKNVELKKAESELLFTTMLKAEPGCLKRVAADGTLLSMNPSGLKLIEASSEDEALGLLVFDLVLPEHRSAFEQMHQQVIEGNAQTLQFKIQGLKGTQRWMETYAVPFNNPITNQVEHLAVTHDITERKISEQIVLENEQKFRMMCEAIPQQVWTAHPDGHLDYVNRRVLDYFDLTFDQFIDQGWKNVIHPDDLPRCQERWAHARQTHQPYEIECRLRRGFDLSYRPHIGRALPMLNSENQVVKWFGTNTDITKLKQMEAQQRQGQKMEAIGTLAGGIAHDFNNVLGVILGFAELAKMKVTESEALEKNLEEIIFAGRRAKDLVQHILAFSRYDELVEQPINLNLLLPDVLKMLRATLPSTIEIHQNFPYEVPPIFGDQTQIHQIILNLGSNAEYAMRHKGGGILEVGMEKFKMEQETIFDQSTLMPGDYIRLWMKDRGEGIPPAILNRIFDPFFTTKGVGEGTGMGLSVVHGIVTAHRGAISVQSTVGQGTTFEIFLPAVDLKMEPQIDSEPWEISLKKKARVLFVDDEMPLACFGKEALEALGCKVDICVNGADAWKQFRKDPTRYDVVISDQTMPGITGEKLAKKFLKLRDDLPIILCTGFTYTLTPEMAKQIGIKAFLKKPVLTRDLIKTLNMVL